MEAADAAAVRPARQRLAILFRHLLLSFSNCLCDKIALSRIRSCCSFHCITILDSKWTATALGHDLQPLGHDCHLTDKVLMGIAPDTQGAWVIKLSHSAMCITGDTHVIFTKTSALPFAPLWNS